MSKETTTKLTIRNNLMAASRALYRARLLAAVIDDPLLKMYLGLLEDNIGLLDYYLDTSKDEVE